MRSSFLRLSSRVSQNSINQSQLSHFTSSNGSQKTPDILYEALNRYQENRERQQGDLKVYRGNEESPLDYSDSSTQKSETKVQERSTGVTSKVNESTFKLPVPRCTADSSFASTSKHPFPSSASSSYISNGIPTPTSILLSSITSSLPTSEPELYKLLRRITSTFPSIPARWYYEFILQPHFSTEDSTIFRSSRIWTLILDLSFSETNLKLVETILETMKKEFTVGWNRDLGRILLKGYRKLGMEDEWREVLARLQSREGGNDGEREWVVEGRNSKRISKGSKGKGKATDEAWDRGEFAGGEGIGWKGWNVRTRDFERARLEQGGRSSSIELLSVSNGTRKSKKMKKRPPAPEDPILPTHRRTRVLIPPQPEQLSSSSLSQLIQLLVQDQRTVEAYALAEAWLTTNKPTVPPSSPTSTDLITRTHRYNSTLFVLVNILLKPLLLSRSRISTLLSFLSEFISKHSPPSPLPQPRAPISTLRELLSGLLGRKDAWRTSERVVDHFGYQWGLPLGDTGFEGVDELRLEFEKPSRDGRRSHLCPDESKPVAPKVKEEGKMSKLRPHRFVPPSVAIILLRHAIDSQSDPLRKLNAQDLIRFREWWKLVYSREPGSDCFQGSRFTTLLVKAGSIGLLEPYEGWKERRKEWFLTRQRLVRRTRQRIEKLEKEKGTKAKSK